MSHEVSVIIPTLNEEENIVDILEKLKGLPYEVIIVDDNSTDKTIELAKKFDVEIIVRKNKKGIASAIIDGFERAKGEYVVAVCADGSDDIEDIERMRLKMDEGWDIIYTNRFKKGGKAHDYPKIKFFCNRAMNYVTCFFFLSPFTDMSNAFKMYRREQVKGIILKRNGFDGLIEISLRAYMRKGRFTEIGVSWRNRKKGQAKLSLYKSGWKYLTSMLGCWVEWVCGVSAK